MLMEGRTGATLNLSLNVKVKITTDCKVTTETKISREKRAWLSPRDKINSFYNITDLLNEDALVVCYLELDAKKAIGIDGVDRVRRDGVDRVRLGLQRIFNN
jgi:hypothetical protein